MHITNHDNERTMTTPPVTPLSLPSAQDDEMGRLKLLQSIAWMDALGVSTGYIEAQLKLDPGTVTTMRINLEYQAILRNCLRVKADMIVKQSGGDIEALFNDQIGPSVSTMIQIRDNPIESGKTRLQAAKDFLDRAPDAPKVRKELDSRQTTISIPVSELRNMQQALIEEGSQEDLDTVELLEGTDYVKQGELTTATHSEKFDYVEI